MNFSKDDWERALSAEGEVTDIEETPTIPGEAPIFRENEEGETLSETESKDEAEETVGPKLKSPLSVFEWVEAAIFALIAISLIFAFVLRTVGVDGDSMNYTLLNGDKLLLSSYPYTPERGDIVVINRYNDEPLIKRVIAVGGDTLDIDPDTGKVILNGAVLEEDYLDFTFTPRIHFSGEVIVPDGSIFVMGDNRSASHDSRYSDIGFVPLSDVMGKALLRIAPFESFGSIYED